MPGLAADQGLVNLHDPAQQRCVVVADRVADAVREVPRRLVGDLEHPLELLGRYALLRLDDEVDCEEPLPKRQVRVVKQRPRRDGELIAA
jgi:hypothetical protein